MQNHTWWEFRNPGYTNRRTRTLWVSQLMLVTPSTRKSKGSNLYHPSWPPERPAGSKKGTMKLPRQQSTCKPTLYWEARRPSAGISSWFPSGKLIADPTILIKSSEMVPYWIYYHQFTMIVFGLLLDSWVKVDEELMIPPHIARLTCLTSTLRV